MKFSAVFASLLPLVSVVSAATTAPMAVLLEADTDLEKFALPTTENGLTQGCKAVTFLFARGTNEAGNVGARIGPQVIDLLRTQLGTAKVTAQGLPYAANVLGYLAGGDGPGTKTYISQINTLVTACPSTKIVLSGYSQGAQIVHNAADEISAAVSARITAVVVFGDPDRTGKSTVPGFNLIPNSKVLNICHTGDIICTGSGGVTEHLNYEKDAGAAAAFIVKAVGSV